MSQYENDYFENNNIENFNNLENDNFYYLTENENDKNNNYNNELNENIYNDEQIENIEHMENSQPVIDKTSKTVNVNKREKKSYRMWLYIFLIILVIALVMYFLIDKKVIQMPSLLDSASSPTMSQTLGSTFMSINK